MSAAQKLEGHVGSLAAAVASPNPEDWRWPAAPAYLKLYDKYTDREHAVALSESEWVVPTRGVRRRVKFSPGRTGTLQRTIAMLTHGEASPGTLHNMAFRLVRHWTVYLELLRIGPLETRRRWGDIATAAVVSGPAKALLSLACRASVGTWLPAHEALVKGLPTSTASGGVAHRKSIEKRERLLATDTLAALARILDQASTDSNLSPDDVEGLATLALAFQHGMRPVQLIALRLEHVRFLEDAAGETNCIVSFHAAKRTGGGNIELPRQVRTEWVPLIRAAHARALQVGREKLFASNSSTMLLKQVHQVCGRHGQAAHFNIYDLRHSAVQSLADGGHSRSSLQAYLGHSKDESAASYMRASRSQAHLINSALGASKLYDKVLALADGTFVSIEALEAAEADHQIGGVVGDRLVAGVGLCKSGQPSCRYNPVTSCYGCDKFMPSLDRASHAEAVAGMRSQVLVYLKSGVDDASPAYRQLTKALSGAQQTIAAIDALPKGMP